MLSLTCPLFSTPPLLFIQPPPPFTFTSSPLAASDLSGNLFQGRLDEVATHLRLLTALQSINLSFNWFSHTVPGYLFALPNLSSLALGFNYLTGSLPGSIAAPLKALDVQFNFLAGSFPALGLAFCSARINCFTTTANCKHPTRPAEIPRAAASCAICNTTNAQGKLCSNIIGGGICSVVPHPALLLPPGTPNSASSPVLPLVCTGATSVPMDAGQAAALMNVKVALGVSFPDWRVDALCTLVGSPSPAPGTWNGVACDDSGKVLRVSLKGQGLTGSIHSEISKLTTLTADVVAAAAVVVVGVVAAVALVGVAAVVGVVVAAVAAVIYLQYNYLYGVFPPTLLTLKTLSTLSVAFNYLTGSLPTALPTTIASLDVQSNFLAGSVPANTIPYCASTGNCLVDASKCASLGLPQRSAAECAVCGSTNGQGALCAAATTCRDAAAGAGVTTPPTALSASLPLFCEAVPMDLVTTFPAQTMLAIKSALGATLTDWTATLPSPGTCTLEGQTPGPGAWTGVYCSSKGVVVGIDLSSNLFQRRLDVFLSLARLCPQGASESALPRCHHLLLQLSHCFLDLPLPSHQSGRLLRFLIHLLPATLRPHPPPPHNPPPQPFSLPPPTHSKLSRNYLTGTVPAFKTSLKALNVASNLLSGSFPIATLTACDARSNCLSTATNCANAAGTAQRLSSECSVCGSTDASGVLCGGGLCAPDASAPAASSTPNTDGQPLLPLSCLGVPMDAAMGLALLSVKASLGVTFTDWNVDAPCALPGQAVVPGSWSSVVCDATGKVLTLELNNNLFSGRLDSFLTPLLPVKTLKVLHVHNNYLSGAVPLSLTALSALSELKIQANYLTGSMPAALPASLKYLDASGNYLVGTSTALIAAKTVNTGTAEMYCAGAPMDAAMATALLNVKASLGVSFTNWAVSSPCAVEGVAAPPGAWSNVLCDSTFKPVSLKLSSLKLTGRMHSDISKLTTLTSIDLHSNLLQGRLDAFTTDFKALKAIKQAYFNFNWFSGSIPSALVGIASLTSFGASYNYLYGPVPKLGAALKTLDLRNNWLSGTFPGTGFLSCSASSNCLANTGACNTTGTTQRPLASCAVCDSPKGTDPICAGGTCAPNTAGPLASSTTPTTSSPILPRFCVGVPLNVAQAAILLSVKSALGVTFTQWSASILAVSPKATSFTREISNGPKALERRRLAGNGSGRERLLKVTPQPPSGDAGMCTIQGQTPVPESWPGVFCSSSGMVVGLDLRSFLLRGTVHADISKLTTLTALYLSSNLFFQRLDSFVSPILPTASLKDLRFSYNYLTGSLSKPGATVKVIDTQANFLSGTFPTASLACNTRLNCFSNASGCFNLDGTDQRTAAECSMCGSPQKTQGLCGGGTCLPVLPPSLAKVPNSAAAPTLMMTCAAVPLDATSVAALLKVGAALGVRDIDWRNGSKCNIEGQSANPKSWPGVWCSANGTVLSITLANKALRGIIHADISKLTALSYLDLSYNLFSGQLSKFVSNMLPVTTLATLRVGANYLTGTLPTISKQLQVLAIASNLLAGAFPTQPFQLCDIRSNCLSSPGSCTNDAGVAQRTSGCAFCGSATGAPPFCAGTTCTPDVAAFLAAGTVNSPTAALPAMFCDAVPVDDNSVLALLALRAGLGVSASSWAVDSPCTLAGNAPAVDSWTGVVCDLSGQVLSLNVASNLLDARMSEWALPLTGLKALKQLSLNYNWFSGPLPSFLLTMSSLSALNVQFNYLAGPITGTPSASLKSLNVASNLLTGAFPASSTTACDARSNCLADSSKCLASGSSSQRLASDCNVCGLGSSSAVVCNGGVCTPDTTEPVAALTPNSASAALLPMQCSGVRIDATAVSVLGSLKAALGVPLPDWGVNSLCTVVIVVSGVSSSSPRPRDLGGVLCSPAGAVVEINLITRQLAGSMHADISKLTALTALAFYSNFLAGRLDAFTAPFTALSSLENLQLHDNYLFGPIPSALIGLKSLSKLSLGSNYLTGSVPVPGTAMKHLDLENNYLVGTFPAGSWLSCSARTNCFSSAAACTADGGKGTVQRATCSICGSADGTGVLCGGGGASTCQPTAASLASLSTLNSPSSPALPLACSLLPAVPVNSTAMATLLSIKTALGVTHTGWAANAVCTLAGTAGTVASGSLTGVECDSAGNPIKITLNNQQLFGVLPADVTKLTALTYLNLQSNLFRARIEDFALRLPALTNLAVLLLDYNWFKGSLPPPLLAMTKLTRLSMAYNYLTYRVPPVSASLKAIVLSNNFLSGTFPANSATSCVSAANCFTSATACNTPTEGGDTAQRASGCDICGSASGQGMLCGGTGVCTPNAAALFTAKTPNTASAAFLPMACVDLVCAAAAPVACPTDWRCQGLKCAAPTVSNCVGYLCTP
ncbi:unnamed protein product [Closterium sp. Naga37s-1]|nr:unnamed protein product [Closterium sp. Naga37s-1]